VVGTRSTFNQGVGGSIHHGSPIFSTQLQRIPSAWQEFGADHGATPCPDAALAAGFDSRLTSRSVAALR
jgi:hypothetical protein